MKVIDFEYQPEIIPESSVFSPHVNGAEKSLDYGGSDSRLVPFRGVNKLRIDGSIVEDSAVTARGLHNLDGQNYSTFLNVLSALYPTDQFEVFGYRWDIDSKDCVELARATDVVKMSKRKYSAQGSECQPIFSKIGNYSNLTELASRGGPELLRRFFEGFLVFNDGFGRSKMESRFWQEKPELDLDHPLFDIAYVPNLLDNAHRVIGYGETNTHKNPIIYGKNMGVERKRESLGQLATEHGFVFEEK